MKKLTIFISLTICTLLANCSTVQKYRQDPSTWDQKKIPHRKITPKKLTPRKIIPIKVISQNFIPKKKKTQTQWNPFKKSDGLDSVNKKNSISRHKKKSSFNWFKRKNDNHLVRKTKPIKKKKKRSPWNWFKRKKADNLSRKNNPRRVSREYLTEAGLIKSKSRTLTTAEQNIANNFSNEKPVYADTSKKNLNEIKPKTRTRTRTRTVPGMMEPSVTRLPDNKDLQESNDIIRLLAPNPKNDLSPLPPVTIPIIPKNNP